MGLGIDPNEVDDIGCSAIQYAAKNQLPIFLHLIDNLHDLFIRRPTILHDILSSRHHAKTDVVAAVGRLIQLYKSSVEECCSIQDATGNTPLYWATKQKYNASLVRMLLSYVKDMIDVGRWESPLCKAVRRRNIFAAR